MDRSEVLERLDAAGADRWPIEYELVHVSLLRAAAELIRQGGWRPIAEAPEGEWLFVGKPTLTGWFPFSANKAGAIANGYTHYLPMPELPAREVENG